MGVRERDSLGVNSSPNSLDGAGHTATPPNAHITLPDKNPSRMPPAEHGGVRFFPYFLMRDKIFRRNRVKALLRDKFTCQKCGMKEKLQVHHKISFVLTGDNSVDNLQVLCKKCNCSEHKVSRKLARDARLLYERAKYPPYV